MITVAVHSDHEVAAAEFFELFKTEWRRYSPDSPCSILLTDGTVPADCAAELCLLFSSKPQPGDGPAEIAIGGTFQFPDGSGVPVYTPVRLFSHADETCIAEEKTGRALAYSETRGGCRIVRIGYDLFDEVAHLLSKGQPTKQAAVPSLDRHIAFVRNCILDAGIPVVEIPPCPPGFPYMVCLTHDVDFVSIRQYGFGRTFQGFARRALVGSLKRVVQGRITWRQLFRNYAALLSVPLVHLGLKKDFWMQFDTYRRIEEPFRSTFFLIPFKGRAGENVTDAHPERRAARYELEELREEIQPLLDDGWEFGLHGIDAWHDADSVLQEKERLDSFLGRQTAGLRMHWLCRNEQTSELLDDAGFEYDSTCGYNETVGFRAGTSQAFVPLQAVSLLEVPLHVQDVSLFYPAFLDLDDSNAWKRCMDILDHCRDNGGVFTVLWHMRSLAPERLWDTFYERLLDRFVLEGAWVGTARQTADWFRNRRQAVISRHAAPDGEQIVRISGGTRFETMVRIYHPKSQTGAARHTFTDEVRTGNMEIPTGYYEKAEWNPLEVCSA